MVEKQMRLDRFLAEMGQGTRSGVREQIRKGRCNGKRKPGEKAGTEDRSREGSNCSGRQGEFPMFVWNIIC